LRVATTAVLPYSSLCTTVYCAWGRERLGTEMNQERFDELTRAAATNDLSRVSFGRSRFLRLIGLGLLGGVTANLTGIREAAAKSPATTSPCGPSSECSPGCSGAPSGSTHSPGSCPTGGANGGNCWFETATRPDGCTDVWKCCDYFLSGSTSHCHCSTYITTHC
jgi:hypothetical protein